MYLIFLGVLIRKFCNLFLLKGLSFFLTINAKGMLILDHHLCHSICSNFSIRHDSITLLIVYLLTNNVDSLIVLKCISVKIDKFRNATSHSSVRGLKYFFYFSGIVRVISVLRFGKIWFVAYIHDFYDFWQSFRLGYWLAYQRYQNWKYMPAKILRSFSYCSSINYARILTELGESLLESMVYSPGQVSEY